MTIAAVDASVILLLAVPGKDVDRRKRARSKMQELKSLGVRFAIPAPAIAEVHRDGDGREIAARVFGDLGGFYTEALDDIAAANVGQSLRMAHQSRPEGLPRACVKFDAMIAGVAHTMGARYLLTTDGRDFRVALQALQSKVEVIYVDAPPPPQQVPLIETETTSSEASVDDSGMGK